MDATDPPKKGGERQPARDDVERAHDARPDDPAKPVEPEERAEPEAFTPITPLGSGAPWGGSLLRPSDERAAETPEQRERARDERSGQSADQRPREPEPIDRDEAEADDYAARSVIMSNALPGGASPVAGAITARNQDQLEPSTDEERLAGERGDESAASPADQDRHG